MIGLRAGESRTAGAVINVDAASGEGAGGKVLDIDGADGGTGKAHFGTSMSVFKYAEDGTTALLVGAPYGRVDPQCKSDAAGSLADRIDHSVGCAVSGRVYGFQLPTTAKSAAEATFDISGGHSERSRFGATLVARPGDARQVAIGAPGVPGPSRTGRLLILEGACLLAPRHAPAPLGRLLGRELHAYASHCGAAL